MHTGELGETCAHPLSATAPAVFAVFDPDAVEGAGPIAFGVAADGVRSVSFTVGARKQTVPVNGNLFSFAGDPSTTTDDYSAPTPHDTDLDQYHNQSNSRVRVSMYTGTRNSRGGGGPSG
jgi:hypothetical protein